MLVTSQTHSVKMQKLLDKAIALYGLRGVHPAASVMPWMDEASYTQLLEDVRQNGFLHPARVTEDYLLIDGRNRICASIELELDVPIEPFTPSDPMQYVLSD